MRILREILSLVLLAVTFSALSSAASGQELEQDPAPLTRPRDREAVAPPQMREAMIRRVLDLAPEQEMQIQQIHRTHRPEIMEAERQLRQSQQALYDAINSENPDQKPIEELITEVTKAQAALTRVRVKEEMAIRKVLTTEQIVRLRSFRRQMEQIDRQYQRRRAEVLRQFIPQQNNRKSMLKNNF